MLSKFHKNAILTGTLDAYCLACEQCMNREEDIVVHIQQTDHIDKLKLTPYCDKYKDDYIRKVKRGYYCECCNVLFSALIKVRVHISEAQHINNKVHHIFTRTSQGVVAFGRILISEDAWNGFIGGNCFICNKNVQDNNGHKSQGDHILNLIESKVEFLDSSPYREALHGYQCLICNEKIELGDSTLIAHFDETSHKSKLHSDTPVSKPLVDTTTNVIESNIATAKEHESKTYQIKDDVITPLTNDKIKAVDSNNTKVSLQRSLKEKDDSLSRVNYIQKSAIANILNCMICQLNIDEAFLSYHLNDQHHKTLVKLHRNRIDKLCCELESANETINVVNEDIDDSRSKIVVSLTEFQNNGININLERDLAVCRRCSKTLTFKFEEIEAHVKEHNELAIIKDTGDSLKHIVENITDSGKNDIIAAVGIDKEDDVTEVILVSEEEIAKNNKTIAENNEDFADNNKYIAHNNVEIMQNNEEIVGNNEGIAKNNKIISENNEDFGEKKEEIAENNKYIAENNEEMVQKNEAIVGNNKEIAEKNKIISMNNEDFAENKEVIAENNEAIVQNNEEIVQKNEEIIGNNEEITENNKIIAENNNNEVIAENNKNKEKAENNEPIAENNAEFFDNDNIIENNEVIPENNKEIAENNGKIAENNEEIAENNEEIVGNNEESTKNSKIIAGNNNNEVIAKNDKYIAEKNKGKAENNEPIAENNAEIFDSDKIAEQNEKIAENNEEITEKNEGMNENNETFAKNNKEFAGNIKEVVVNNEEIPKALKEEVAEMTHRKETHRDHDKNHGNSYNGNTDLIENVELHAFVETLTVVKDVMTGFQFVPIYDKIAVSLDSFLMIVRINFKYYMCYFCDVNFSVQEKRRHIETPKHSTGIVNGRVITSLQTEFVREIRPGEYHCGVCNTLYSDWGSMKAHLNTIRHKEIKQNFMWFLRDSKHVI